MRLPARHRCLGQTDRGASIDFIARRIRLSPHLFLEYEPPCCHRMYPATVTNVPAFMYALMTNREDNKKCD